MQNRWQGELFVAGTLEQLIPDDHILKRVDAVLDLSWLRSAVADCYCADNGRPSIDPEAAMRLMLAGFLHGIVHDRKLMREAQVNIAIRWFAGYSLEDELPDHSSLSRLRQRWGSQRFLELFEHSVQHCIDAGLVAGDLTHVDATLVRANVSLDSLVKRHAQDVLEKNDGEQALLPGPPIRSGRLKCVSRTDPDCAMATNRRGHFSEPTYKTHMAADSKARVIVDISVTPGDHNEGNELIDQIDRITRRKGRPPTIVTADAGYAYGKVYGALESRGIEPVIPVKAEPKPRNVIPLRRFKYDEANQVVRCPEGKLLRRSTKAWHGWYYKSSTTECKVCPRRTQCLSPRVGRRTIVISDGYAALLRARRRRLRWQERETAIYRRHRGYIEGVNAEAKRWHGMGRAVRRGLKEMAIQAYLTAAAINLKRLAA
jgi:transposase